jgi:DNA polymerase-1
MTEETRLLVCDGTNLYWRAYHGLARQAFEKDGQPTFAVYGTVNSIATACRSYRPTHLVVVFDWGKSAYRLGIWPKYKLGRPGPESEIMDYSDAESQLNTAQELLVKFGVQTYREFEVEADDIIATVVDKFKSQVSKVIIMTGDKDMRQLIDANVVVEHPSLGQKPGTTWDIKKVVDHYGVGPSRLPEIWALCGDKIDNIPGVRGIGEKTAIKFIEKYGDLQGVTLSDEKKIEGFRHDINMSLRLVQANPQLSAFALDLDNIIFTPVTPTSPFAEELRTSLNDLGFDSIVSRWSSKTLWAERGLRLQDLQSRNK